MGLIIVFSIGECNCLTEKSNCKNRIIGAEKVFVYLHIESE